MNNKKGISLIVLVITILVMIILAGVVIVSLQNDNPIDKAKFAKTVDSVQSVRSAISQYAVTKQASTENQTGVVDLTSIPAAGEGALLKSATSLKGYKDYCELNTTVAKSVLGVDPSKITDGKFYVHKTTGASVFVLNKVNGKANKFDTELNGVDGVLPSTTID